MELSLSLLPSPFWDLFPVLLLLFFFFSAAKRQFTATNLFIGLEAAGAHERRAWLAGNLFAGDKSAPRSSWLNLPPLANGHRQSSAKLGPTLIALE